MIDPWGLVVVRARDLEIDEAQWGREDFNLPSIFQVGKQRLRMGMHITDRFVLHYLLRIPPDKIEETK